MIGSVVDACTSAIICGEAASEVIIHDAPTDWISPPKLDAIDAIQIARKIGIDSGEPCVAVAVVMGGTAMAGECRNRTVCAMPCVAAGSLASPQVMRPPFTTDADGATLTIRANPKASRTAVAGVVALEGDATALALRVAAPPVDGAANDEVMKFVAKQLRVRRGSVTLVSGQTGRVKRLRITGDPGVLEEGLRRLSGL
jgi:uncharacterized protein (TIGR00251 family)